MGLTTPPKVIMFVVLLLFMISLCFSLLPILQLHSSDLEILFGQKTMHGTKFRKVLSGWEEKEKKAIFSGGKGNWKKKKKSMVERELRAAPWGPDPLHHNGGGYRNKNNSTKMQP